MLHISATHVDNVGGIHADLVQGRLRGLPGRTNKQCAATSGQLDFLCGVVCPRCHPRHPSGFGGGRAKPIGSTALRAVPRTKAGSCSRRNRAREPGQGRAAGVGVRLRWAPRGAHRGVSSWRAPPQAAPERSSPSGAPRDSLDVLARKLVPLAPHFCEDAAVQGPEAFRRTGPGPLRPAPPLLELGATSPLVKRWGSLRARLCSWRNWESLCLCPSLAQDL